MPMSDPVYPNRQPLIIDPDRELPEHATPSEFGHIPGTPAPSRLNSAAESVGSALGTAVSGVRELPSRLQEAKARFTVIRGRKQRDVHEAADQAIDRIREASAEAQDQAREGLEQVRQRLDFARKRAERLAHDFPLHVIAGAAAFGMLLGIGLRVWRDHAS